MNATQAGRLLTLAHFIETQVPRGKLQMEHFANDAEMVVGETFTGDCGAGACALGWASTIWPNDFQVRVRRFGSYGEGIAFLYRKSGGRWRRLNETDPPVCRFFGVTNHEARLMFGAEPSSPKNKAAQIRRIVDQYGYEEAA